MRVKHAQIILPDSQLVDQQISHKGTVDTTAND